MRDLTKTGFNTNSPQRSYFNLCERVEALEGKLSRIEQGLIDALVKLNKN